MSRRANVVLGSFAPPGGPGLSPREGEVDYAGAFATMLRRGTKLSRLGLLLGLWIAWLAPLWMSLQPRTLGDLSPVRRSELLARLLSHRLFLVRELTLLLKVAASLAMLGTPSVRARSGYDAGAPT